MKTEAEAKGELTRFFFLNEDVPECYWLRRRPLDLTDEYHCRHLIARVREGMPRPPKE